MSYTSPTAKALSRIILQRITSLQRDLQENSRISQGAVRNLTPKHQDFLGTTPPLKRIRHPTHILYLSAIAHRLVPQYGVAATKVATEIAQAITQQNMAGWNQPEQTEPLTTLWQGITVQVTATNDLLFQIHDRAIAIWLNHLIHHPPTSPLAAVYSASTLLSNPFPLQYAHARCCCLLQLADRTGLITLQGSDSATATWQWVKPQSIPWLTPTEQLYPNHVAERHLISQLCTVLDQWSERSPTPKLLIQQAEQLSQAFQVAHRAYPIWGDRSPEAVDRQQAHLALLLVTQRVLRQLLDDLEIPAPREL